MTSPWTVRCDVAASGDVAPLEIAGIASMLLFDFGALAIGETGDEAAISLLAGFASEQDAQRAAQAVDDQLPTATCSVKSDPDYDAWILQQREGLSPTTIGRWHIRAPWHEKRGDQDIVIDPGAAFGHGAHPSTQLALDLLLAASDSNQNYETVVDLGTGTGVLAIIAAKNGRSVRATEYDSDAVAIARENIERNGVDTAVELTHGDAAKAVVSPDDLVAANVTIDVHRRICHNYATANHIIVAGLLTSQKDEMVGLLPTHTITATKTIGEWAGFEFRRD